MVEKLRDKAVEIVVFGVLGGVLGASIGLLSIAGFKAEHIFSLTGAIIGAAAAVGGAAWLSDRNARIAHQREVKLLVAECSRIKRAVDEVIGSVMMDSKLLSVPLTEQVRATAFELRNACAEFPPLSEEALQQATTLSFDQRVKLASARDAVNSYLKFRDTHASNNYYGAAQDWLPVLAKMAETLERAARAMRSN